MGALNYNRFTFDEPEEPPPDQEKAPAHGFNAGAGQKDQEHGYPLSPGRDSQAESVAAENSLAPWKQDLEALSVTTGTLAKGAGGPRPPGSGSRSTTSGRTASGVHVKRWTS